nr:CHASE2 domain-containing protein [Rhodovibrio sodomensis]
MVRDLRNTVFDSYQRIQPRPSQPASVLLVDIDEASLARIGQWPWARTKSAELLDRLTQAGAAAIALDIVLAEPDMSSPDELIEAWREVPAMRPAAEFLARSAVPDHDDLLADAIGRAPSVLGNILSADGGDGFDDTLFGVATLGANPRPFLYAFDGADTNLQVLESAAQGLVTPNVIPDHDSVVRRLPMLLRQSETVVPALADALRVPRAKAVSSCVAPALGKCRASVRTAGSTPCASAGRPCAPMSTGRYGSTAAAAGPGARSQRPTFWRVVCRPRGSGAGSWSSGPARRV